MPGRCQHLKLDKQSFILDVGHNEQAFQNLASYLIQLRQQFKRSVIGIFTALKGKDIGHVPDLFNAIVDEWVLCSLEEVDVRGQSVQELERHFVGLNTITFTNCTEAFQVSFEKLENNGLLVIFGSFVLVGEFLNWIEKKSP